MKHDTHDDATESGTITVEKAALRLGIGRQLAYDLARKGEIPGVVRLGRRILVRRKILEDFLAGRVEQESIKAPISSD